MITFKNKNREKPLPVSELQIRCAKEYMEFIEVHRSPKASLVDITKSLRAVMVWRDSLGEDAYSKVNACFVEDLKQVDDPAKVHEEA